MSQTTTNKQCLLSPFKGAKHALFCLMALFLIGGGVKNAYGAGVNHSERSFIWSFAGLNYDDGQSIGTIQNGDFYISFYTGSNQNDDHPSYWDGNIRLYGGNTFTVSSTRYGFSGILFYHSYGQYISGLTANHGSFDENNWHSYQNEYVYTVTFTVSPNSSFDLSSIKIYYDDPAFDVAAPTFSIPGGTYETPQDLILSCTTEGATIKYTLNGDDPKTTSLNVYIYNINNPIQLPNVNHGTPTITVKAYATKNSNEWDDSEVVSATYTIQQQVENIAALRACVVDNNRQFYKFSNEALLTFKTKQHGYMSRPETVAFIHDESGDIFVYDEYGKLDNCNVGDKLSGLIGKLVMYKTNIPSQEEKKILAFSIPSQGDVTVTSSNNPIPDPTEKTFDQISVDDDGLLVKVYNVRFNRNLSNQGYNWWHEHNDYEILDNDNHSFIVSNIHYTENYVLNAQLPTNKQNITGNVIVLNGVARIVPRTIDDFENAAVIEHNVTLQPNETELQLPVFWQTLSPDNLGPSEAQNIQVSGSDLHGDLVVNVPENIFEVSLQENGDYARSVSITPQNGTVEPTTVYIRLCDGLIPNNDENYTGYLTLTSAHATSPRAIKLRGRVESTLSAPTISSSNGSYYFLDGTEITITAEEGTAILYTTDGTPPNVNGGPYTGPFTINETTTIKAFAINEDNGLPSAITTATFIQSELVNVTFSVNGDERMFSPLSVAPGTNIIRDLQQVSERECPNGFSFVGWSTDDIRDYSIDQPRTMLERSYEVTDNVTLYAVFAIYGNERRAYSHYVTNIEIKQRIGDIQREVTWNGNSSLGDSLTILSGGKLTINGVLGNAIDNLIFIEDGGQLVVNNPSVKATIKKNINAYSNNNDKYYLITPPVTEMLSPEDVQGLFPPRAEYDLYQFDQAPRDGNEWRNYKAEEFRQLEPTKGYLYASNQTHEIYFIGTAKHTTNCNVNLDYSPGHPFSGFNLIGNPYPCNAYVNVSAYVMNPAGDEVVSVTNPILQPSQGFFVQATERMDNITIYRGEPENNRGNLSVSISENGSRGMTQVDRAIVSFRATNALPKFSLNASSSKLYIPQGDTHFAVVNAESEGTLPLCFKAAKNGEYSLSFSTEGIEAEYLHLIDNLTGADTDLLATSTYSFSAKTTDYASRFKLVFKAQLNEGEQNANAEHSFAYLADGDIIVSNEGRATLQVIDMLGHVLSSSTINGDCHISTSTLTAGLYILNLNGMTQKIVVR